MRLRDDLTQRVNVDIKKSREYTWMAEGEA